MEELCGCKGTLLLCDLVNFIKLIQKNLMPAMQANVPVRHTKYKACKKHTCANRNKLYEWRHIYQSRLRQIINSPNLLSFFSFTCLPQLEPGLYQRLKQIVEHEDGIFDKNKEILKQKVDTKNKVVS